MARCCCMEEVCSELSHPVFPQARVNFSLSFSEPEKVALLHGSKKFAFLPQVITALLGTLH